MKCEDSLKYQTLNYEPSRMVVSSINGFMDRIRHQETQAGYRYRYSFVLQRKLGLLYKQTSGVIFILREHEGTSWDDCSGAQELV